MLRRMTSAMLVVGMLLGAPAWAAAQDIPAPGGEGLRIAGHPVTLDSSRLANGTTTVHAVLLFRHIPVDGEREALAALGVTLHQYLPDLAYIATVPAGRAAAVLGLPFVAAGEPMRPEWKVPSDVFDDPGAHMAAMPGGECLVHVYFYPDTPLQAARETLAKVGAQVVDAEYRIHERLEARMPAPAVALLLRAEEVRWVESARRPVGLKNKQAADFHGVTAALGAPLSLSGAGVNVGVMDGGEVQANHPAFGSRVTQVEFDGGGPQSHPTHVTGTILGSGAGNAAAKGMAPAASAWIWNYNGDIVAKKTTGLPTYAIVVDNNSWGDNVGWQLNYFGWTFLTNTSRFGAYDAQLGDLDGVAAGTGTLINFAAGNDGTDDGYDGFGYYYFPGYGYYSGHYDVDPATYYYTWHYGYHAPDGGSARYGNLLPQASLKNGLSVGAIDAYGVIADFSSSGPAADGRLKPDVVAVGVNLLSTVPTSTFATKDGTSMATPVVTGIAALVVEAWKSAHGGTRPRLDVLKGLLLHSTFDLGKPGPDFRYGFGGIDAEYAASIADYDDGTVPPLHRTGSVSQGGTAEFLIYVSSGASPLWVTLCWTDRPGSPAASKALVNDLDLVLQAPSGAVTYPFKLNPKSPSTAATRGVNTLDNVERAEVAAPEVGTWKVRVTGTTVPLGSQAFAVWFSRPYLNLAPVADAGSDVSQSGTSPTGRFVQLTGLASTDPNGAADIVDYRWDTDGDGLFDDVGGSASGPVVSPLFPMGATTAALRVTDSFGLTATDSVQVTVTNDPPVAGLGGNRTFRATDPGGRTISLDGAFCSDPQTAADIVAYEWDLDGDGAYDDATGQPVDRLFAIGTSSIGLRIRDNQGLEATAAGQVTVVSPENSLLHGGTFKGTLGAGGDADSFFFEAAEGTRMTLAVKTKVGIRVSLRIPDGGSLFDQSLAAGGKGFSAKGVALPASGWYWLDLAPFGGGAPGEYAVSLSLKPPAIRGTLSEVLSEGATEIRVPVLLLAGSKLTVAARGSRKVPPFPGAPSLEILDPAGGVMAKALPGRPLKVPSVPVSGLYVLRAYAENGAASYGGFTLSWKGSGPRDKVKLLEGE